MWMKLIPVMGTKDEISLIGVFNCFFFNRTTNIIVKMKTIFRTEDGLEFESEELAKEHESSMVKTTIILSNERLYSKYCERTFRESGYQKTTRCFFTPLITHSELLESVEKYNKFNDNLLDKINNMDLYSQISNIIYKDYEYSYYYHFTIMRIR